MIAASPLPSRVEEFLATGEVPSEVGPLTARSWMRSHAFGVVPDAPLDLRYTGPVDDDSALLRAARPIAEKLLGEMEGSDVAMLLTDAHSCVLGRWCGNAGLARRLEEFGGSPGFVFEESRAGTNALGTVLEEGRGVEVIGPEHYAECLRGLSAVGMPVRHPVSGRIEGVVDLVCPWELYSPVMKPLIARAAEEIGARLLTGYAGRDRVLLHAYLQAERRGPRRPMLAINARVLIANPPAADLLRSSSHALLWDKVDRAMNGVQAECTLFHDDEGSEVQGTVTPIRDAGERVGAVVQLRKRDRPSGPSSMPAASSSANATATSAASRLERLLPGASSRWQATLRRGSVVFGARERLLLAGAPGVGKRALALALCAAHDPAGEVREYDAANCHGDVGAWPDRLAAGLEGRVAALVLTHLDLLDAGAASRLGIWLDRLPAHAPPVVATCSTAGRPALPAALVSQFPHVVELPKLADRPEDVADIAAAVVRDCPRGALKLDPAAVRLLVAAEWPGNVRQLRRLVLAAGAVCPGTVIRPDDLPDHLRIPPTRMKLTRMQRSERETIAAVLAAEGGNKLAAAASLGISRSTLYRKLNALGL